MGKDHTSKKSLKPKSRGRSRSPSNSSSDSYHKKSRNSRNHGQSRHRNSDHKSRKKDKRKHSRHRKGQKRRSKSSSQSSFDESNDDNSNRSANRYRSKEEEERERNRQAVKSRPRQWQLATDEEGDSNEMKNKRALGDNESIDTFEKDIKKKNRKHKEDKEKDHKSTSRKQHKSSSKRRSYSRSRSRSRDYYSDSDSSTDSRSHSKKRKRHHSKKHSRRKHDKKHKKSKHSKKESKHKSSSSSNMTTSQDTFGKYGIIKESDYYKNQRSFEAWMAEVKKIPSFTGPKWELMEYFKEFCEDFNTATMSHVKYYNYDKWEMEEYARQKESLKNKGGAISDEAKHLEYLRQKQIEKKKKEEEMVRGMMSKEKIEEMKMQAQLKMEMNLAFKTGDEETKRRLMKKLEPDEKKISVAHPWSK